MSWAKKRIQQYSQGQKASWLEERALEHANPVNCIASIVAFLVLAYGLWVNDWIWIIVSLVTGMIGHLYCWLKK